MTTLIVTSSAHGSTREIAERVAEVLRTSQAVPTVVEDVEGAAAWLATADAVIVAAPVYTGSLAADARAFLDTRRAELADLPLVILASGGAPELARPVREKLESYGPREVAYFRGALVEERLGRLEDGQTVLTGIAIRLEGAIPGMTLELRGLRSALDRLGTRHGETRARVDDHEARSDALEAQGS